jgi:hypothetical protein
VQSSGNSSLSCERRSPGRPGLDGRASWRSPH